MTVLLPLTFGNLNGDMASSLLHQEMKRAQVFAQAQHAASTQRAYLSDVSIFNGWCYTRDLDALPATPQTVAMFLADQAEEGTAVSTLSRRIAAIRYVHSLSHLESPTNSELVKATLKGIRRVKGSTPEQKAPATAEILNDMLRHIPDTLQGLRDKALLLLGFAGAFRRSELAALTVDDIQETQMGLRITIKKSKTDQENQGQQIAIYQGERFKVVDALKTWCDAANITQGAVFRPLAKGGKVLASPLSTKTIAKTVKHYAALAGLNPEDFAGHSLRAGFITSAAERGASLFKMMEVSRHKSVETLKGYVRRAELFKDHAGAAFL